jgi:RND family efflux transporter MFP subunit
MIKGLGTRAWWLVSVAWLGLVSAGCRPAGADAEASTTAQGAAAQERVVNVEAMEVQPEPFRDMITVTGSVEADRDVQVTSEESGVIREVFVDRGARVSEGQAIARIDDELLRAQHDQAEAEAKLARETWERQRRLWEEDSIGSELAYLRSKYGAETAEASARALAARLERTVVRAPIGGILDDRYVEVGTTVAPGARVARVIDVDPLSVIAGVSEQYAGEIGLTSAAIVAFDNGTELNGRVKYVSMAIDDQNRTFAVEVVIPNRAGRFKPGMVARVRLSRGEPGDAILVPREAVLRAESGYIVYVVSEADGVQRAEARPVVMGSGDGPRVVVREGLAPGERVIVVGQQQVTSGDRIEVESATGAGGGE